MSDTFQIGERVKIYLDSKFGEKEGWYEGTVFRIDPYSEHRSFYWVELSAEAQLDLGMKQISVFNLKNIKKVLEQSSMTKNLSLTHLTKFPASSPLSPDSVFPTILSLHGRGSNESDLLGLAEYLPKNFLWISPRGTFDLGPNSYEWFQITQVGKPDPTRLANAIQTIDKFIDEIIANYPVDKNKLYLMGFSQGSIVSMSYALTKPQRVAGVIAQSGYIPHESGLQIDEAGVKGKPFLLTHGVQDPMLPVDWARRSRDTLQKLGTNLEYYEFNMGHTVSAESLAVINTWLSDIV